MVISHPAAALYIQPPIFATTVAIQSAVKTECRNGLHGDDGGGITCRHDPSFCWRGMHFHEWPSATQRGVAQNRQEPSPINRARQSQSLAIVRKTRAPSVNSFH